jgi:hypothetical protein
MDSPNMARIDVETLMQIKGCCRVRRTFDEEPASESDFGAFQ